MRLPSGGRVCWRVAVWVRGSVWRCCRRGRWRRSPRSVEAVAAIVGVLKSGAAYVPIDPGLPAGRVGFIVGDAAPVLALTTSALADRFEGCDLQVFDLDDPGVDSGPGTVLAGPVPDDIAH